MSWCEKVYFLAFFDVRCGEEDDLTKFFALKKSTTFCKVSWFILPLKIWIFTISSCPSLAGANAYGRNLWWAICAAPWSLNCVAFAAEHNQLDICHTCLLSGQLHTSVFFFCLLCQLSMAIVTMWLHSPLLSLLLWLKYPVVFSHTHLELGFWIQDVLWWEPDLTNPPTR